MNSDSNYTVKMNFSWLDDNRVAGCGKPMTDKDLRFLASVGIRALVRLADPAEPPKSLISSADVLAKGMEDCPEYVEDLTAPSLTQIERVVRFIKDSVQGGRPTAVSCGAGYGRTGTILACYLVSEGNSAEDAIQKLIGRRPCSDELLTIPGQKAAIQTFAANLK